MKLSIDFDLTSIPRKDIAVNVLHIERLQNYNRTGALIWLSRADYVERIATDRGCTILNAGLAKIGILNHGS